MAIAKNPKRILTDESDAPAQAFISKAGSGSGVTGVMDIDERQNKIQITLRIDPELLARVDKGARRLGISRAGFLAMSAAEKLESME